MHDLPSELTLLLKKFPRAKVTLNSILSSEGPKWWLQVRHPTYNAAPTGNFFLEYSDVQLLPERLATAVCEIRELLETEKDLA